MLQILVNTPLWVWAILAGLIFLGWIQSRDREMTRGLVFAMPVIFLAYSLFGVYLLFGLTIAAAVAWICGVVVAVVANAVAIQSPKGVLYNAATEKFAVPGSWVPLLLMMGIFFTRFVVGFSQATNPALVALPGFGLSVSAILGFFSGMFLARALRTIGAALPGNA